MDESDDYCTEWNHKHQTRDGRPSRRCRTCGKAALYGMKDERPQGGRAASRARVASKDVRRGEAHLDPLAEFIAAARKIGGTPCKDSTLWGPHGGELPPNEGWLAGAEMARDACHTCPARCECDVYSRAILQELEVGSVVAGLIVWKDQRYGARRLASLVEIQALMEAKMEAKVA